METFIALTHYRNILQGNPDEFYKRRIEYAKFTVYNETFRNAENRRNTLMLYYDENKDLMADNGLYLRNITNKNSIYCIYCGGEFTFDEMYMNPNPKQLHRKKYPTCPFIINVEVDNIPLKKTGKHPDYNRSFLLTKLYTRKYKFNVFNDFNKINKFIDLYEREKTFINSYKKYRHFAVFGLYITIDNTITCIYCSQSHSLEIDDIFKLNKKLYHLPQCKKLEQIVNIKKDNSWYPVTREYKFDLSNVTNLIDILNIPGLNRELIYNQYLYNGKGFDSKYELLVSCYNKPTPNKIRYRSFTFKNVECVVCLDDRVAGAFLPCGHIVTCISCEKRLTNCPKCRSIIDSVVYNIKINNCSYLCFFSLLFFTG